MVIIKSKITGKFLRRHSGSVRDFHWRMRWKIQKDKVFMSTLSKQGYRPGVPKNAKCIEITRSEIHKRMYDAEPLEAGRYASPGSALSSIGKWIGSRKAPECRTKEELRTSRHVLPAHLEIHEIVAGNLCLVNPDDSEEIKRKKKKNCK